MRVVDHQLHDVDGPVHLTDEQRGVGTTGPGTLDRGARIRDQTLDGVELLGGDSSRYSATDPDLREVEMHHEYRVVRDLRCDRAVRVADREQRRRELTGRVVERVRAERGGEIDLGVRLEAPGNRGAVREARFADRLLLQVAAITPIGVEEPGTAVRERGFRCVAAALRSRS